MFLLALQCFLWNMAKIKTGNANLKIENLRQDEDVLDTWASSWLWPISVFNGFKDEKEIAYYYPTNDLVTAQVSTPSPPRGT
jgi:valyl-tRNA synthetase